MSQAKIENNVVIGSPQEVYKCLVEEFHIRPEKPLKGHTTPTFYQLTPLEHQIQNIRKNSVRTGEIYYTKEWGGENGIPYTFEILHVKVQIVD